jgi:hypothetical protein
VALIRANTTDTLALYKPDLPLIGASGWRSATGEWCPPPAAGPYVITSTSGVLSIEDNTIDCGAYAEATAGGRGILLFNDRAGARISVVNNKVKNATAYGIQVVGAASKPILYLELRDNKVWDDQNTPTCLAAIQFVDAASLTSIQKLVMSNNSVLGGVATNLDNVAAGTWLVADGDTQEWTGFGGPEAVVTAPVGSRFWRKDGGVGTILYVKETGVGNTGWAAVA